MDEQEGGRDSCYSASAQDDIDEWGFKRRKEEQEGGRDSRGNVSAQHDIDEWGYKRGKHRVNKGRDSWGSVSAQDDIDEWGFKKQPQNWRTTGSARRRWWREPAQPAEVPPQEGEPPLQPFASNRRVEFDKEEIEIKEEDEAEYKSAEGSFEGDQAREFEEEVRGVAYPTRAQPEPSPERQEKFEEYRLTTPYFNIMVNRLTQNEYPRVECFASAAQNRLPIWWGPGSPYVQDAFTVKWSYDQWGLLYANPPWSLMEKVVRKLLGDQGKMLLVMPHWPKASWFKIAMLHSRRRHLVEPGPENKVFEPRGGVPLGLTFPIWGVLLDYAHVNPLEFDIEPAISQKDSWKEYTAATERREKRKFKKAEDKPPPYDYFRR